MTVTAKKTKSVTAGATPMTREQKKVILASSVGTVFEWYDFYLYGSLAVIIGKQFFSALDPGAAFIFALLAFAAGFIVRPFGALVFGRIGDMVGRKYTFMITIVIMGVSTFAVGLLPDYSQIGLAAPVILVALRLALPRPPAMEAAVAAYFSAWNAHDVPALVALFTPAGTLRDWDVEVHGAAAVGEANAKIFAAVPNIKIEVLRVHAAPASSTTVGASRRNAATALVLRWGLTEVPPMRALAGLLAAPAGGARG
jgi:hypothetical protein